MPKTKITAVEIESLIAFGEELDRRMKHARIGFAELSRLTDGAVSTGYISDIVRAGRRDSQKYFRLGREKVVTLAKALKWDTDEALDFAGFKSSTRQIDLIDEAIDNALPFHGLETPLDDEDRAILRSALEETRNQKADATVLNRFISIFIDQLIDIRSEMAEIRAILSDQKDKQ